MNYVLKKTERDNFDCYNLSTIEIVLKSFYMDDFLKSVPLEEQSKQLCQEMIEVMAAGGFKLTKFKSNSPDYKHERSTNHLKIDKEQVEQTLGVSWRTTDDCFTLNKSIKQYTKNDGYLVQSVQFALH